MWTSVTATLVRDPMVTMFWLLVFFQLKHLVCDYLFQPPYMYKNKGTYGHPGGLLHSAFHVVVTFGLALWVPLNVMWVVCAIEFLSHYHVDYFKTNIGRSMGWGPTTSENFWRLLGFDQFLHQMTYVYMVYLIMGPNA